MVQRKALIRRKLRRKNRSKKTSRFHPNRLRLVISRSLKHFEAQIIDDSKEHTLISISTKEKEVKSLIKKQHNKTEICKLIGKELAKRAKKANVGALVLDRNGLLYHGRVKAFTESAREHGLEL